MHTPQQSPLERNTKKLEISELEHIREFFKKELKGQDQALSRVANYINQIELGLRGSAQGALARWVEIGPSGVGKTEAVLLAIKYLQARYPQKENIDPKELLLKVNGAEFQYGHEISRLTGSPPGYLGSGGSKEGDYIEPFFSEENINRHRIKLSNGRTVFFVLIDEVEKADASLHRLLLSPLDKGDLSLGDNTNVDFRDAVIVFSSNLGNEDIATERHRTVGFTPSKANLNNTRQDSLRKKAYTKYFPPELRSRMGGEKNLVIFHELAAEDFEEILDKNIKIIISNFQNEGCNLSLTLSQPAKEWFLRNGTSPDTGARDMASLIDMEIMQALARGSVDPVTKKPNFNILHNRSFTIDIKNEKLVFLEKEASVANSNTVQKKVVKAR